MNEDGTVKKSYKLFWTWDHSTNWTLNVPGNQSCGSGNAYTKNPEVFLSDYKRVVNWCAENGIDGVGIVGLLRDKHGGIETARELCGYAREHGVRIYAIVGLYAYGGVFHEGNSPYSLDSFLKKNPDCMGRETDGSPLLRKFWPPSGGGGAMLEGCPSSKKLNKFILESLDWLFKTIPELGGIQMETGDNCSCMCGKCREKRHADLKNGGPVSFENMADIYPDAVKTVLSRSPDAWAICETYHHFLPRDADASNFGAGVLPESLNALTKVPEQAFWQWVCDQQLNTDSWKETDRIPEVLKKYRHIMRSHYGTYWRPETTRNALDVKKIRIQCRLSSLAGIQGVSIFGENSPFHPNAEFNYLALSYFGDHPMASIGEFADKIMAPRLGGKGLAEKYLSMADTYREPERIPETQREIVKLLPLLPDPESIRRWIHLNSFLNSFLWESRLSKRISQERKKSFQPSTNSV